MLARILARKSARVGQVGGQVGEDRRACPARGKLNEEVAGHPRDDPRAEVGEDVRVRVRVGVRVGAVECQLYYVYVGVHCAIHCKNIRISTDILWWFLHILTEPVPNTFVGPYIRNSTEYDTLQCGPRASLFWIQNV